MEKRVSKTLSYWLRHAPEDVDLSPDRQGYVNVDDLLAALRDHYVDSSFDHQWLDRELPPPGNKRFERRGRQVRARYGHTIDVELGHPLLDDPGPLFHGTSPEAWKSIREEGLLPAGRQYVHLSREKEEALRVGRRHANEPVLLRIVVPEDAERDFYRAGQTVLTDHVPAEWIHRVHRD